MDKKKKTINSAGVVEVQKKEHVFEAERARRMYAYNYAARRLLQNT